MILHYFFSVIIVTFSIMRTLTILLKKKKKAVYYYTLVCFVKILMIYCSLSNDYGFIWSFVYLFRVGFNWNKFSKDAFSRYFFLLQQEYLYYGRHFKTNWRVVEVGRGW